LPDEEVGRDTAEILPLKTNSGMPRKRWYSARGGNPRQRVCQRVHHVDFEIIVWGIKEPVESIKKTRTPRT